MLAQRLALSVSAAWREENVAALAAWRRWRHQYQGRRLAL